MKGKLILIGLLIFLATTYASADIKVLVLEGNISRAEFPILENFTKVGDQKVKYEKTKDRALPGLDEADVLWIGQGEICDDGYFLDKATEDKIKSFVNNGGIAISIGQDSDPERPCETGWLPGKDLVTGFERGSVNAFELNKIPELGDLFRKPNNVKTNHFDDTWGNPAKSVIVLAFVPGNRDVGVGLIKHGKGTYMITSIENEDADEVAINTDIMENLIHYAVNLAIDEVERDYAPSGSLAPLVPTTPSAVSKVRYEVVQKDVMIPMRDGIKLAANIYRPARDGVPVEDKLPILLHRTPYGKEQVAHRATYFAPHGYVAVVQDWRGRHNSEGVFTKYLNEAEDGYDTIEWLAQLPYTDGQIGMWGTSAGAHAQAAAAQLNPPHLKTIVLNMGGTYNGWDHAILNHGVFAFKQLTW
ncbi:CocE/NonD family hydrolase, partial [Acidobacteria bacterium AH-259-L09]|nr:CocE/NonD family hydrolase [Acidobacteria bacterium AH-259-L09]